MRKFKDNKGRDWSVSITFGSLQRCKDNGVDLTDLQTIGAFGADYFQLGLVIHTLLSEERESRSIDDEDFYEGFKGDATQRAIDAILEDLSDFTPPALRPALERVISDRKTTYEMIAETVASKEVDDAAKAKLLSVKNSLLEMFSNQAGHSLDSSESNESDTLPSGS